MPTSPLPGAYAIGLVVGLRFDRVALVRGGMATLFLVVGKLFLVDLAQVEAIWRVLLFLGFGSLFLALSYYLRSLWKPGAAKDHRRVPQEGAPHVSRFLRAVPETFCPPRATACASELAPKIW